MKLYFQYKDPEWNACLFDKDIGLSNGHGLNDQGKVLRDELNNLGLGEYILIEYDTQSKVLTIVKD